MSLVLGVGGLLVILGFFLSWSKIFLCVCCVFFVCGVFCLVGLVFLGFFLISIRINSVAKSQITRQNECSL